MITNYRKAQYLFGIDDAIMIPSLIAGGTSLLGSIFGAGSNASANKTNKQIADQTNAANLELAQMQNQWNIDQWNRENEYNSPTNQLKLIREAGLNPNYFMGSVTGNSGAHQLTSADLANQQTGAAMQGYDPQAGFASAAGAVLQGKQLQIENKKADAEIENLNEQNETQKKLRDLYSSNIGVNNALADKYAKEATKLQNEADESVIKQRLMGIEEKMKQKILDKMDDEIAHDKKMWKMAEDLQELMNKGQSLENVHKFLVNQGQKFLNNIASDDADVSRWSLDFRKDAVKFGFKLDLRKIQGDLTNFNQTFRIASKLLDNAETAADIEGSELKHRKANQGKEFEHQDNRLDQQLYNDEVYQEHPWIPIAFDLGGQIIGMSSQLGSMINQGASARYFHSAAQNSDFRLLQGQMFSTRNPIGFGH